MCLPGKNGSASARSSALIPVSAFVGSPCYTSRMLKRSLAKTNPYLSDPAKRRAMFQMTVCTSTDVEGVKLTSSDLGSGTRTARKATSRESAKSSRSRR
jgi:hypothetical protein